ncbi:Uncharacterised protein [Raoultella planticola]|uniref:Uncharacterized protein n=1 Tax=Raoultella planticola TaxID=575 RepID=A0A485AUM0_RAOPL|nr:Uncharacterised protein [Raoultella planticola]
MYFARQPLQVRQKLTFTRNIQRGQRFIKQQKFRRGEQRSANRHTLLFSTGQAARQAIQQRFNTEQRHQLIKLPRHTFRHAVLQIAAYLIVRKQARVLKYIAHPPLFRGQADAFFPCHLRPCR